ncbi:MAG TPA: DUF3147 family protein [Candidatus Thalassarchaeaceae archaeon]|jgi:hypothetical protein|nr:hypothetical protein [Euryarchaeota archaeon]DAC50771.1 MAG TPA: DUF3147 family protein [Candidatus Poseidoniales archaeon]HIH82900.1 DUF3147 family protein [Candidatus Thalassarchaeaceae archaeon]|tara:strand:+ start:636 stop:992 length:357 start_codon:yes stop_codon:yes gene_type:complete
MVWWHLAVRGFVSGGLVVGASELAKRNELMGALLVSIPLVSILAIIWLYNDTTDTEQVADFTTGILWLVIPSLVLFISLPIFLRRGIEFWPALGAACALTILAYYIGVQLATKYAEIS